MTTLRDDFLPVKPFSFLREILRGLLLFYSGWFFSSILRHYLVERSDELRKFASASALEWLVSPQHFYSIFGLPLLLFGSGAIAGILWPLRELLRGYRARGIPKTGSLPASDRSGKAAETEAKRPGSSHLYGRTLQFLIVSILIAFHFKAMLLQRILITGESMEPALKPGRTLWIEKISTGVHLPDLSFPFGPVLPSKIPPFWPGYLHRGDIVVFLYPAPEGSAMEYYIKRVIALPGDRYAIRDGRVYVNDSLLPEGYLSPGTRTEIQTHIAPPGLAELPEGMEKMSREIRYHALYGCPPSGRVPAGTLFVLGDNRAVSRDSRSMGFIPLPYVAGVARWIR